MNIGNFKLGSTFDKKFTTRQADGTPITFAGSPALAIYRDNSTTEITAGVTLTVDFDGRTGLHNLRVVTTDGAYIAGNYDAVVTAGTVDGVSVVGEVVFSFSLENRHPHPNDAADALLKRDFSAITGEAARSVLNALRLGRSRMAVTGGNLLTVYKEDGTTPAVTFNVVLDANGNITSMTPTT